MASLSPPGQRPLLDAKVDVGVESLDLRVDLTSNEFEGGAISPKGFVQLESFSVFESIPTWRFAIADALLELKIFMAQGANTSYLGLELLRNSAPLRVILKPYAAYRDYHAQSRGAQPFPLESAATQCPIRASADAQPYRLMLTDGELTPSPE